ncbi:putative ribonuclease H-like domain-containing protein [Tanacetum coccineum]
MSASQDDIPPPPPPPSSSQTLSQPTPHTVSTIKLPILKKGEYDIWAIKMEHYLAHTDYPIWEVRKIRTTLLMALPEDHLAKFHKMTNAKEMWDAIKSRFGGNDESKKMQKYILMQQFEGFSISNTEGLHKGYDRFQSLLSQLEIHEAGVSTEDAHQKFLRSLPSAWSQVSLIMRNKPRVDTLSFDDLYNKLRVFDCDIKASTTSSSGQQNVAFISKNTSSTNDVSTAYYVPNPSSQNSKYEQTSSYSLLANQSSCPQLDHEDLEQIDEYDLEEMDLKWQVAMISMRMKEFLTRRLAFSRDCMNQGKLKIIEEDAWEILKKQDGSRTGKKEDSKALVTVDGEGVDWSNHLEDEDYASMACNGSDSNTEVNSCSTKCKESYANLKKLYDAQREQLSDASIEIKAYSQGLKKVEAQLVAHQQEAQKEKDDLKAKVEKWHHSSKNLGKLLNSQMSAYDKFRLGYGDHRYNGILSYENEVLQSVFKGKESDFDNPPLNDRLVKTGEMHDVPPPMIGNYMPSGPDVEIDDSKFTYGPKQTQPSESESQTKCQPKIWSDAPIIEEYESNSEDECVAIPTKQQETPSFANQQVKTPRENVKSQFTHSQKPKVNKKELGYGFPARACFVCGSFSHLIRDCDYHEKRMAKIVELNKQKMAKGNGSGESKPKWNNVQRVNKQNQFVPTAVLTRTGKIPVSTARASSTNIFSTAMQSFNRQSVLTTTAMKVNTFQPNMNRVRPTNVFQKTHSRPFKKTTGLRTDFSKQKVNTVKDYPHRALKNKGIVDSGCSRHMTGNKAYLAEFQDFNGGPVAFGGSKGYITGKGKIKTGKLDFEDVCFVKELQHFNLFSVSQMCDKKNKVLFTDSECLVLSPEFKLPDENHVLLKVPRQNNMYSFNLENIVPSGGLAYLIAKATTDESNKWHRRLGHVNFKNLNKLVKGNLVRGLPSKLFQNDHTCVACQKGKQHKASCKAKTVSSISHSLQLLHMDLFGPTSDETSAILKDFIRQIENQLNQKVKTIRCDNGTEFKNKDVIEFCGSKGIKREYSNARTPQQNGVAERKNRTLIEAARTMLADSFLPNTFWAEAVSTACYVLNRVLVTKPHNKTPYELLTGKIPIISYIRPFGCHVTILNTIDHLGKFAGKSDEGFLVGYSLQSKAFRVYNLETKRVEENLHITFLENKPNVAGKGPTWLFDLDYLTDSMNYHPVRSENQVNLHAGQQEANQNTGTEDIIDAGDSKKEDESDQDCFVLPIWPSYSLTTPASKTNDKREDPREEEQVFMDELERLKRQEKEAIKEAENLRKFETLVIQEGAAKTSSTNIFSTVSTPAKASSTNLVNTVSIPVSTTSPNEGLSLSDPTNPEEDDSKIPPLEDIYQDSTDGIFTTSSFDDAGAVTDFINLETIVNVSPIPTSRIYSSHPSALILRDPTLTVQTRSKVNKSSRAHAFLSYVQKHRRNNHKDFQHCLFACFLSQNEPKKTLEALEDES